jgi:gliding motility-associated-like protein
MILNFKQALLLLLMFVTTITVFSQDRRTCGTDPFMEQKLQDPVFLKQYQIKQKKIKNELLKIKSGNFESKLATLIIPVAVHYPEGLEQQRSCLEDLARSQVEVLNKDYTATNSDIINWGAASGFYPGTNTAAFDVKFVLANKNHPINTDDDLVEGGPAVTIGYNFGGGGDQDIKWAGYKNFLVKTIAGGILGYSPLGGSISNGAAVVMSPQAFGSSDIASGCNSNGVSFIPGAPYDLGRTVTHELGHYFTLNHTFQGGCAGNNDGHDDTPAIPTSSGGCPSNGSVPACNSGQRALTMNYMDYTNDACMWMFTQDQVDAIQAYWIVESSDLLTDVIINDFSLVFSEDEIEICELNDAIFEFDYQTENNFSDTVEFSATGNPAGSTVVFSPSTVNGDTNNISMTISGTIPVGVTSIIVKATYGSEEKDYPVTINVFSSTVEVPNLTAPINNATGVVDQTMNWDAIANASSYEVNIYSDSGLTSLVENANVLVNTYSPTLLSSQTMYYWTVMANNTACGTSNTSVVFNFETENIECINPSVATEIAIPNGVGAPGEGDPAEQIIAVTDILEITDVNVILNVTHPWLEDLRIVITSPSGTTVELFANILGNSEDFVNTIIDDEASVLLSDLDLQSAPFTGSYRPDNLLSAFDGESAEGDWKISVYDFWNTDVGTLDSWSLEICGIPLLDTDNDGIPDASDNCPLISNPLQEDFNSNGIGDACEDSDGDGINDNIDNCPSISNPLQEDANSDGQGDVCQDTDGDGINDDTDNCLTIANPLQEDFNSNGIGDACEDSDGDGINDDIDNCPSISNPLQEDFNSNGIGDACEDTDGDGLNDDVDNCPSVSNPLQEDANSDGQGDVCQDTDNDGIFDNVDNCPLVSNPLQEDFNNNGIGDACEDTDGDGLNDDVDNCQDVSNPLQGDFNNNGIGDACEDTDGDGLNDDIDNCPSISNPLQEDSDSNGEGDVCQDTDGDGIFDNIDNCILVSNPLQEDFNNNGIGDACEDTDGDGINDDADNCPLVSNPLQEDFNSNGIGDACEDSDGDGLNDDVDNCPSTSNPLQLDSDSNGIGDVCQDSDGDGIYDDVDNCLSVSNPLQEDFNNNGIGDACEDTDGDGINDDVDNCIETSNPLQVDTDGNGVGDVCQDTDSDGIFDDVDNCVDTPNPDQEDVEGDGVGDACQIYDADGDGILDDVDNCVDTPNPDQEDIDGNGIGDACQDTDDDGVLDINDNCVDTANPSQDDVDGNGVGDACQDVDNDGILDIDDNCPLTANSNQADANNDGIGDVCESIEPADTLTPNGDLQNDTWNIQNIENVDNTVKVFNRYGVKVFSASNYVNNTWGGESSEGGSGLLPAGSYYYVIDYVSSQGESKTSTGWIYINY